MMIKMNLKGNFKTVPEGERVLTITKAECTPSGKPNKIAAIEAKPNIILVSFNDSVNLGMYSIKRSTYSDVMLLTPLLLVHNMIVHYLNQHVLV